MSGLTWQEASGGWDSGPYRVSRSTRPVDREWQLRIVRRGFGWEEAPTVSAHRTRRGAMASATIYEMQRVRRLRLQIHLGVFVISAGAWMIASLSIEAGFVGFLVWVALFAIALTALANALDVLETSTDIDLPRNPDRLLAVERWLRVDSLIPPRSDPFDVSADSGEASIRVLDPLG